MKAYLDNGATTQVSKGVQREMQKYFSKEYGNASSVHQFGRNARKALEESRKTIAQKIGALPEEIVFTSGGSEANNLALKGIAFALREKGNHIITTQIEHPSVLETCQFLEKRGFEVSYLKVNAEGIVDLETFKNALSEKTILVSIMHANNEIGSIQPIETIAEICQSKGIAFHSDCVQSLGKIPINVQKIPANLLSFSAHKLHGPKGVGALFVRKGTSLEKQILGGHQEYNKRAGTENVTGIAGFAQAVKELNEKDCKKMKLLRNKLVEGLEKIPDVKLNGPCEKRLCNNASISFQGIEGEGLLLKLDAKGIAVSTGSACSSQSLQPSHVLLAIGLSHERAHGTIRYTLSKFTTAKEISYAIKETKKAVQELRA
ncbi:MAG: cysteine desulfurase family protein, partial [Candidatus Diapherotrites archaeon]